MALCRRCTRFEAEDDLTLCATCLAEENARLVETQNADQVRHAERVAYSVRALVNAGRRITIDAFVDALLNTHPTTQQSMVREVIWPYLARLARTENFAISNEDAVTLARLVVQQFGAAPPMRRM